MAAGFNGSGTYLRAYDWTNDKTSAIKIQAVRMDEEMDGMASALSVCLTRDGQTSMQADLKMGNNRITGLGPAIAADQAVRLDQVPTLTGNNTIAGDNTYTGNNTFTSATGAQNFVNNADSAGPIVATFQGDRAVPADNDAASISFVLSNDIGAQSEFARLTWQALDVNAATQLDGALLFGVTTAGVLNHELFLTGAALSPIVDGGLTLGNTVQQWLGAYLKADTAIWWAGGTVSLAHTTSPNRLTLSSPTELHIPGTFYATGNAVIGDASTDSVTIKGVAVNSDISNNFGATHANFVAAGMNNITIANGVGTPNSTDLVLFRDENAGSIWRYHNCTGIVTGGLQGLGAI